MNLELLLSALGLRSSAQRPRSLARRSRRLLVENLEDRSLMAVANLDAYRPVTEFINYALHSVPESQEGSDKLGPGIRVNGDDDNGTLPGGYLGPDYRDPWPLPSVDNDLVQVDVSGAGSNFSLSWDPTALAVWTTASKSAPVNPGEISVGQSQPLPLWVEYVAHGAAAPLTASLTLTVTNGFESAQDSVLFHRFQSVVIAIGGNSQDPRNFGDPRLGTFTMAGALYDQGYDVHMYSHNQIQSSSPGIGQGAAYNEVVSAVLQRDVDNVAIFGYSWGGGATYELSYALSRNTALVPAGYKLQYTAYVDGIRHTSLFSAETRLPIGTMYHDNFYQRKDWLLKGNSVAGANNVNVTTQRSWGKGLVHTTIDDSAELQAELVGKLMTKVIA